MRSRKNIWRRVRMILPLKKAYFAAQKKHLGTKALSKKMHTALEPFGKKSVIENELFTFSYYEGEGERITIGEAKRTLDCYFTYTNLHTHRNRIIIFDKYGNIQSAITDRVKRAFGKKIMDTPLESFFNFHIDLIEQDDSINFDDYLSAIINTKLSNGIELKNRLRGNFPNIQWNRGLERVQLTKLPNGFDIDHSYLNYPQLRYGKFGYRTNSVMDDKVYAQYNASLNSEFTDDSNEFF